MSYYCLIHKWHSVDTPCPICFQKTISSSNTQEILIVGEVLSERTFTLREMIDAWRAGTEAECQGLWTLEKYFKEKFNIDLPSTKIKR